MTSARRERLLALIRDGESLPDACKALGVPRGAVERWRKRGHVESGTPAAEFVAALELAESGEAQPEPLMTEDQVRRELEQAIRKKGSASAIKIWYEQYGAPPTGDEDVEPVAEPSWIDELAQRRAVA